jgi:hypothetical protein
MEGLIHLSICPYSIEGVCAKGQFSLEGIRHTFRRCSHPFGRSCVF